MVDIYDGQISKQLSQDVEKHNKQYPGVTLHKYTKAHDRFLIIDEDAYHIGCLLYTSPSPRDISGSRMTSSA